jgi:plastocyanin
MRVHRCILVIACTLLGAAVPVLPAAAGSEASPTVEALKSGFYYSWSPPHVTIAPGGSVNLSNPSPTVAHGVKWVGAAPTCEKVPVDASATEWHGSCTFPTAGTYTFYCTVHGSEMTGTIAVGAEATPTPTTTTYTQPGTGTGAGPAPTTTNAPPGSPAPAGSSGAGGSPPAGGLAQAVRVSASQRGSSVHGSLELSASGAGGRLEVDLLARRAALAKAGVRARVGRLVRSSLPAGRVSFSVALNARGRAALRRHRRLALEVRLLLAPSHGAAVSLSRGVLLLASR